MQVGFRNLHCPCLPSQESFKHSKAHVRLESVAMKRWHQKLDGETIGRKYRRYLCMDGATRAVPEVRLVILLSERLGERFSVGTEEFLAALLQRSLFLTL